MNNIAVKEKEDILVVEEFFEKNVEINKVAGNTKNRFELYSIFKRFFDIVLSFIGLIICLPIFLIISILIKFDSKGPAIFKQPRVGKNGKTIYVYKFRSMVMNAEQVLEELMASNENIKNEYLTNKKLDKDPRVTKIGKFIRKTSIDELPQLLNVLKGDMSLIGPIPYLFREIPDMGDNYYSIIRCRPGITGYWQVNGRSDTTFEERCVLEKYYSLHINLWMDIKIIFKTVLVVLFSKGAK